jgi:hypothetical protein
LAVALLLSVAPAARALTLADLQGGASFMSTSDPLLFDNFSILVGGALSTDLSDYTVIPLEDGFMIAGPIGVSNGFGDILIEYDVWAKSGDIDGASLLFNGAAFGFGSLASISEDFFLEGELGDPIGDLLVFVQGVGSSDKFDETSWDENAIHLHVVKDILVVGGTFPLDGNCRIDCPNDPLPGLATISLIVERFDHDGEVTEPLTGSMLGFGLMGLWRFGRRRDA